MKTLLIIILMFLLFDSHQGFSQKHFHSGYIITNAGDSIKGRVMDRKSRIFSSRLYKKVRFKKQNSFLSKKKFGADQIHGYGYDGKNFRSMPYAMEGSLFNSKYTQNGENIFFQVMEEGKMSLYFHEYLDEDNRITGSYYLKRASEFDYTTLPAIGFRKKMISYFADTPELRNKIQSREFRRRDIIEIVKEYNRIVNL